MNAAFFDAHIIAYAAGSSAEDEHKRNQVRRLMLERTITTSTQVMMELYGVLRKKLGYRAESAMQWVQALQDDEVVSFSPSDVITALQTAHHHEISHWDGLILVSAERGGLDIVYTEGLSHGQRYGQVLVCNPFIEDFLT